MNGDVPPTSCIWASLTPPLVSPKGQSIPIELPQSSFLSLESTQRFLPYLGKSGIRLQYCPNMTASADFASTLISEFESLHPVGDDIVPPSVKIRDKMVFESDHPTSPAVPLSSHPLYRESTALHPFRPASINARRAACTHISMERLYGLHQCSICLMPSPMGWVYCCVQDERNSSPKEEFPMTIVNDHVEETVNQKPRLTPSTNQETTRERLRSDDSREPAIPVPLSPWIEKAILQGHYTQYQVSMMRAQRQKAIDAVVAAERHVMEHPEHSADLPTSPIISSHHGASIFHSDTPKSEVIEQQGPQDRRIEPPEKPRMFPRCHFHACQTCRPTFRDRAWTSIEDAFAQCESDPFIDFENDQRPLMSKTAMSQIGLRVYQSPSPFPHTLRRPGFHRFNALRLSTRSLPYQLPPGLFITEDLTDPKTEVETKGFRESMKRAFRGMLDRNKDLYRDLYSTPSSRKKKLRYKDGESSEFDMDLFRQLSDELLQEASGIPLPGHDGMDGLADEEGEIEVKEGVALTEEGVDLGTADIIMSV